MQWMIRLISVMMLNLIETNQVILHCSWPTTNKNYESKLFSLKNNFSSTHCIWFVHPPWKRHHDLSFDKSSNHSVEYFGINEEDHLMNDSYIESSKIIGCNAVHLSFYTRINSFNKNMIIVLLVYKQNEWNQEWEYRHNDSQWIFHQVNINMTNNYENVQFRLVPVLKSSDKISIDISIVNMSTYTDCQNDKSHTKSRASAGGSSSTHSFIFVIFGGTLLLIFLAMVMLYVYGVIEKQCARRTRIQSNVRQRKSRKQRNVIRDESTILSWATNV